MKLLALDTTGDTGSMALMDDSAVIELVSLYSQDGFAHVLFQQMEAMLARHDLSIRDIEAFASASGPGSFTGVRVGLTAVKGLAVATGRKAVAVSNLQALAWFGNRPLRASLIDARRGEVYGAVYDSRLEIVCPEVVMPLARWLESLPSGDVEIVTQKFEPGETGLPIVHAPPELAQAIGTIAVQRIAQGRAQDPAEIDANYVRRSDAELFWKDPAG